MERPVSAAGDEVGTIDGGEVGGEKVATAGLDGGLGAVGSV